MNKLILALGNPGGKYEKTRHNAGWLVMDELVEGFQENKYAKTLELKLGNVIYAKPQTFMNLSGESLRWYMSEHDLTGEDIIVVYDDVDLAVGKIKISFDRGDAGHNGIKSLVQHFGSKKFVRVRVGVAPMIDDGTVQKLENRKSFVLKNFSSDDLSKIRGLAPKVNKALALITQKGYVEAMNQLNGDGFKGTIENK
jgi:PTH1 family peptidyl-tRNA hydrolase